MENMVVVGTEFAPWQIKGFSIALRQAITQLAGQQPGLTVAEWLHAYFAKHGLDGADVVLPRQALPDQTDDALLRLAQLARALTPPDRDSAAMRLARSIVCERLRSLRDPAEPAAPVAEPAAPALAGRKPQAAIAHS